MCYVNLSSVSSLCKIENVLMALGAAVCGEVHGC